MKTVKHPVGGAALNADFTGIAKKPSTQVTWPRRLPHEVDLLHNL